MSNAKDVERGLSEEDDKRPLLALSRPTQIQDGGKTNLPEMHTRYGFPRFGAAPPNSRLLSLANSTAPTSTVTTPGSELPSPTTATELLPRKWRRSDRRCKRLNTELLEAVEEGDIEAIQRLLNKGANPNATCRLDFVSACHLAALLGGDALYHLVKFGAERDRIDRLGRTALHLAAWAGHSRQMAILLDFPEDIQNRMNEDEFMSSEAEDDVKKFRGNTKKLANVPCNLGEVDYVLPKEWKDNIDHNCKDIKGTLPLLEAGWTPLHVAAACARRQCTRLLLAAGADPNMQDMRGRTPLDVAGSAHYFDCTINNEQFAEVVNMLLKSGGSYKTMRRGGINHVVTPLHTAVEVECIEVAQDLLENGASLSCLNPSGLTPMHICVQKELEEFLQLLANYNTADADPMSATVDVKDAEGHTVLQAAVTAEWVTGVCVALEAGADVTLQDNNSETPIHTAAALGNLDIFSEILSVAKQKDSLNLQNALGETPLFKAIIAGHLDCIKAILNEGASILITLPGNVNVLHKASELGFADILKELIQFDEKASVIMINTLSDDKRGFGPIHFATLNNHPECIEILLCNGADIRMRTTCSPFRESTPLHIAALKNHLDSANILLSHDKTIIHEVNSKGWFPLHTAAHHGSREIIPILLQNGADLSGYTDGPQKFRKTAIDFLINNLSKPTEYLEDILDTYISTNNHNIQDPDCVIKLDYSVLMPRSCEIEQMKVIEALLKTGNRYGQKRILVHPLVESFLYLKWKALLPFFYTILACYALFVSSLTIFVVSVFFYKDTMDQIPDWLNPNIWGYLIYISIALIILQEFLYMNIKSRRYFFQLETWTKFGSISFAVILPATVSISSWWATEWPRHIATVALLLSWLQMMFLLSRFPNGGYYVLMFGKVAINVMKILATFVFLVIGFSLSFMIQFHAQIPFDGPWAAFVKTIVMMTSEFDYNSMFDEEHTKDLSTSILVVRIIFIIFLVLAAIVLMNLMVGVAVNDINDLEILGNINRLAKQVEFLAILDTLVYNKIFSVVLPKHINNTIREKRNVANIIEIYPGKPKWRHTKIIPSSIRDSIFNKATKQKKQMERDNYMQEFAKKIDEIYDKIVKSNNNHGLVINKTTTKPIKDKIRHEEVMTRLTLMDKNLDQMKVQMTEYTSAAPEEELYVKVDKLSLEISEIKAFLFKLESKFEQNLKGK